MISIKYFMINLDIFSCLQHGVEYSPITLKVVKHENEKQL